MTPDLATISRLAELAKLEFDEKQKQEIAKDLGRMLDFVDKLKELDTAGVEPLIYMSDEVNVLRDDEVKTEISRDEALSNAPKRDSDYFKVPKVLE
jgi:aspartyl-tRNA(Asn)/glutamyl-tRNA(Gln) amidotransferase subunit C